VREREREREERNGRSAPPFSTVKAHCFKILSGQINLNMYRTVAKISFSYPLHLKIVAKACSTPVYLGILSLMSGVMPSAKVYDMTCQKINWPPLTNVTFTLAML
jgi:hypothetical protein